MNNHTRRNTAFFCIFCILFSVTILTVNSLSYHLPVFEGNTDYSGNVWIFGEKDGLRDSTDLSEVYRFEPGKTYVLSTVLDYDGSRDDYPCAFITAGNFEVEAYLDQELICHYTKKDRGYPQIKSMGIYCFSVPLGKECQGRELRIEIRSPFTEHSTMRRLPLINIGDYATIMRNLFYHNLPNMLISCAIIFNVIVLVILSNLHDEKHWSYIYFAVFALFIIIYRGTQDLFLVYLWGAPYMIAFWEYISAAACPVPLLLSFRYKFNPHCKKAFDSLIVICCINLILQVVLSSTGISDFVPMMRVTHIVLLGVALAICILCISIQKATGQKYLFVPIIPIVVGAVLDVLSFYLSHIQQELGGFFTMGNFIGLGLLASLVLMILETRAERMNNYKKIERNKLLEKMAYRDALTGIHNRASFDADLKKICSGATDGKSILCVSADVNGLKKINDTIGHHAGDELICRAATLLNLCLSPYGTVYRLGGDEFFAFLQDVNDDKWEQLKKQFSEELKKNNEEYTVPMTIAIGAAFLGADDIHMAIQHADKDMYKDKQKYHAMNN